LLKKKVHDARARNSKTKQSSLVLVWLWLTSGQANLSRPTCTDPLSCQLWYGGEELLVLQAIINPKNKSRRNT
jgi:hypothetical protein